MEPRSPALQAYSLPSEPPGKPHRNQQTYLQIHFQVTENKTQKNYFASYVENKEITLVVVCLFWELLSKTGSYKNIFTQILAINNYWDTCYYLYLGFWPINTKYINKDWKV